MAPPSVAWRRHSLFVKPLTLGENRELPFSSVALSQLPLLGQTTPRENRFMESFNGRLRDELLNVEIFDTLLEAEV